jgi:Anaphase promoting complex subunit 8 / Cdc23
LGVDGRAAEAANGMQWTDDVTSEFDAGSSAEEPALERDDLPKYLLGKAYFDCKEYERAAFVLTGCHSLKCKFLRLYAQFLVPSKPCAQYVTDAWRWARRERLRRVRKYWGLQIPNECQIRKSPPSSRNSRK